MNATLPATAPSSRPGSASGSVRVVRALVAGEGASSSLPAFVAAGDRKPSMWVWLPWCLSALVHVIVICVGPFGHREQAVFAIDAGKNSLELDLVAAPKETVQEQVETPVVQPPDVLDPEPDPIVVKVEPPKPEVKPEPPQPPQPEKGDGSSPKPGKAATTVHSEAGAIRDVKPDYLRNPPPTYPESARRARQQGLVRLMVIVNEEGRPENIDVAGSSGYSDLDSAAVSAVRNWRFRPAMEGGTPVKSRVSVPVRFRLDS
ncbi:TonB family C-terminal domain-containing protein [Verrucomicrobium sp. GAS474]|uniref:energy transducer TonB n=1 Tax=Verrucomicrobium sp. GAS474 TaxID=1882831 RepID=UPI00087A84B1|nr:energy transducer TonB [Verrucomicrobium sp. GAS474]SDT92429.1 TonB family C-terminal domain-containing protein [Verrucomicrobium sp. GAS474]